jgi:hypothetical protein
MRVEAMAHAIGTNAKKHGVRKADDAGITQQQVKTGHQHHKHQHFGGDVQRLDTWKKERRKSQCQQQADQDHSQHATARKVVRQESGKKGIFHGLSFSDWSRGKHPGAAKAE